MPEYQDEIIILKQFENATEANIAKSKLDAYGIPCFLSGENFAGLYPLQTFRGIGISLHVFGKDAESARQILKEMNAI